MLTVSGSGLQIPIPGLSLGELNWSAGSTQRPCSRDEVDEAVNGFGLRDVEFYGGLADIEGMEFKNPNGTDKEQIPPPLTPFMR